MRFSETWFLREEVGFPAQARLAVLRNANTPITFIEALTGCAGSGSL